MTTEARNNKVQQRPFRIAAIGEVLWDVFPTGPRFGGAPANFACACSGLARERAKVEMISAVGNDELGVQAIAALEQHQVSTEQVERVNHSTGQVHIVLDDSGSASYQFADDCAWDNLVWSEELEEPASKQDAVCFGTLGQRGSVSRTTIQRFVRSTPQECLRVFDVNIRAPYYSDAVIGESLQLANILKLNNEELPRLASLFDLAGADHQLLEALAVRCDLKTVALTRGPDGATIWHEGSIADSPGIPTNVVDTVGAGDSFTAAMLLGLLDRGDLNQIIRHACETAAYVCSQPGATPEFPRDLLHPPSTS